MKNQVAIIIGANSEIGKGLAEQLITNNQIQLIVISRDTHFYQQERFNCVNVIKVNDYQEKTISLVTSQLKIITDKLTNQSRYQL